MIDKKMLINKIEMEKTELLGADNFNFSDLTRNDYLKIFELKEFLDNEYLKFMETLTKDFLKKYHLEFNENEDEIIINKNKNINIVHIVNSLDEKFLLKVKNDLEFVSRSEEKNIKLVYVYLKNKEFGSMVNKINTVSKFNNSVDIYFYDEFLYEFLGFKAMSEFAFNYGNLYKECSSIIGYNLQNGNKEEFIKNIMESKKKEILEYNYSNIENIKFLNQANKYVFLNTKVNSEFRKIFDKNINKFFENRKIFETYLTFSCLNLNENESKILSFNVINQLLFKCIQRLNINEKYKNNIDIYSSDLESLKKSYKAILDTIFINDKYSFTYTDLIYEDKDYTKNYLRKYFYNFINADKNIKNTTIEMIYLILCSLF